jgi:hypothetical protein
MAIVSKDCFHPLNVETEDLTAANSQLIIGDQFPVAFQHLITQTEAFRAVIASRKDIDQENAAKLVAPQSNAVKDINYPVGIIQYLQQGDE